MSTYGKGLKPSTPAKIAHLKPIASRHASGGWIGHPSVSQVLTSSLPSSADLGPCTPRLRTINGRTGPYNQGAMGSCTFHSLSAALSTECMAQGRLLPWVPSMDLGYKTMRALERAAATPTGTPLDPLQDTGGELADGITVLNEYGVTAFGKPANDGRYSDVDPSWLNDEPDPTLLQTAGLSVVMGPYRVDPTDPNVSDIVAACIEAGLPIWTGFFCDMLFETQAPGVVRSAPNLNDPQGGGHAVYLSAFRTNVYSRREFRVENSWGLWCEGGTCWVDELWLAACWDLWPLSVQYVGPSSKIPSFRKAA